MYQTMLQTILYEDGDIIVADKPSGLASIPERNLAIPSLVRSLEQARGEKLFIVHRLDKEASGVILFARHAGAHRLLCEEFERRSVRKSYLLLVHGVPHAENGTIDLPIRQFGSGRMGVDSSAGKECHTAYTVVERLPQHALIQANPLTGRRHQLRVHFYAIGHPLAGDPKYGDARAQSSYPRLMLHAQQLEFELPGGRPLTVSAPIPESFSAVVASVRSHDSAFVH